MKLGGAGEPEPRSLPSSFLFSNVIQKHLLTWVTVFNLQGRVGTVQSSQNHQTAWESGNGLTITARVTRKHLVVTFQKSFNLTSSGRRYFQGSARENQFWQILSQRSSYINAFSWNLFYFSLPNTIIVDSKIQKTNCAWG